MGYPTSRAQEVCEDRFQKSESSDSSPSLDAITSQAVDNLETANQVSQRLNRLVEKLVGDSLPIDDATESVKFSLPLLLTVERGTANQLEASHRIISILEQIL